VRGGQRCPTLSQERAAATLLEGHQRLSALGLTAPRLVQSDGGSDFASSHFQQVGQDIGQWIRCRVAQVGGMGILERLNRTLQARVRVSSGGQYVGRFKGAVTGVPALV